MSAPSDRGELSTSEPPLVLASKALPRPCPSCGEVSGGVFCPQDGTPLEGAFSLGGERYVVEELIGNGAMAIVFGGKHRTLSRPVAVKILRPEVAENTEQQQRFLREARSASQLNHENIVGVLDFGWDDDLGVTYLVMERLFGQALAAELGHGGRMEWSEAVPLLVQIARALGAAHGVGIVHRDLTSRNVILVQVSGRRIAKLCDFGLSRHTAGGDRVTQHGASLGTPAYSAPEQLSGDGGVAASADLYSIGVLAYEMLSGHLPTQPPIPLATAFPAVGVPEDLAAAVERCLAADPLQRPTAAELERMLVRIEARATSSGVPRAAAPSAPTFAALDEGVPSMIGSYRVVRALGEGGTGRVYLGEHPVIGTKVAIKVLLPEIAGSRETVERFIQEARTSSQIESPHIPRYYDFGRTAAGLPYAVMEYFEGETLAERIVREGALSVAESADILGQVAGALHLAHQAGLVHRDLKPENIFLVAADPKAGRVTSDSGPVQPSGDGGFNVKVLDFGIAKTFGKDSGTRTQQGFFLGTPFYCAPEQVFGAEVDPRTDVYGLGATAFEMLTGLPPFVGEISAVLEAKTSQEAPLLRAHRTDVPEHVETTVAHMLARDPAARAVSMTWVQEAVTAWLHEGEAAASRRASSPRASSPRATSPRARSPSDASSSAAVVAVPSARAASPALARASSPVPRGVTKITRTLATPRGGAAAVPGVDDVPVAAAAVALLNAPAPAGDTVPRGRATAPRRSSERPVSALDDQDFDALETIAIGVAPIAAPPAPVAAVELPRSSGDQQMAWSPRRAPWWRRPGVVVVATSVIVAVGIAAYLGSSGSASVATSGPKISPIVENNPAPQPSAARVTKPVPSTARPDPAVAATASATSEASAGSTSEAQRDLDPQVRATPGRRDKRDHGRRGSRPPKSSNPPKVSKDPEPPKDVNFVNPFQ